MRLLVLIALLAGCSDSNTRIAPDAGLDGSSGACGQVGQPCCGDGGTCMGDHVFCDRSFSNPTHLCQPCGGAGQVCCAEYGCNAPHLACFITNTIPDHCRPCGNVGQLCCVADGGIIGSLCNPGAVCGPTIDTSPYCVAPDGGV